MESRIVELEEEVAKLRCQLDQPVRHRMPDTRMSLTHKFEIAGHEGYITVGLFEDGQPGELFIQMAKEGSTIGGLMDTVATLTSIALQYGVPLESLVKKFAYQRFEPSGFTKNPDIRNATRSPITSSAGSAASSSRATRKRPRPSRSQPELPLKEIRGHGEEGGQPPRLRSLAHRREGNDRRHHESRTNEGSPSSTWQRPQPRGARDRKRSATCSWTSPARTAGATR